MYIPRRARRDHFHGQANGSAARHAGHANPQGRVPWTVARLRRATAHSTNLKGPLGDSARFALPSAIPIGTSGLDCQRVGRVRKQAQGQILPSNGGRETQVANGIRKVESHGGLDRGNFRHDGRGSMTFWSQIRSWLDGTLRRSRLESEMDAELRFHLEAYAEDLVSGGVSRQEAMRRARVAVGGVERVKEEGREAPGVSLAESLLPDLRYGLSHMLRTPGFTADT